MIRSAASRERAVRTCAAGLDPLLGPADALAHGRRWHEQRAGDLHGAQAAHCPKGERHLRIRWQCGVTAEQEQGERVVGGTADDGLVGLHRGHRFLTAATGGVLPPGVGPPAGGDGDQPADGVAGHSGGRPLGGRREQGVLDGVLDRVEGAAAPQHGRQHPGCQDAEQGAQFRGTRPAACLGHRSSWLMS